MNKTNLQRIMHDLIWPAAAGNVAWSFIDTSLKYFNSHSQSGLFQMLALLLLALYLLASFLGSKEDADYKYPAIDILHALSVIAAAIGIAQSPGLFYLHWLLFSMFIIAAAGHVSGGWLPGDVTNKNKKYWIALIHLSAAVLCMVLYFYFPKIIENNLYVFVVIAFDLLLWKIFRNKIYYKWCLPPKETSSPSDADEQGR
jgi:hypothetical protein